jgi:hypothetical protein
MRAVRSKERKPETLVRRLAHNQKPSQSNGNAHQKAPAAFNLISLYLAAVRVAVGTTRKNVDRVMPYALVQNRELGLSQRDSIPARLAVSGLVHNPRRAVHPVDLRPCQQGATRPNPGCDHEPKQPAIVRSERLYDPNLFIADRFARSLMWLGQ